MIPTKCAVCGKPLVYPRYGDKPMCFEGTGHTIGPPCTRKEFDAAVKAAAFAALPQADRLPTIGGWRVSDRSGVFWFSTLQADESERVPGAVRARVESSNTVRWFCPDEHRERAIESAGFVKRDA